MVRQSAVMGSLALMCCPKSPCLSGMLQVAHRLCVMLVLAFFSLPVCAEKEAATSDDSADVSALEMPAYYHLQMDPVVLSYLHPKTKNVTHYIVMTYGVEVSDQEALDRLKVWQLRVHDQVLQVVPRYLSLFWRGRGEIDQEQLIQVLRKVMSAVIPNEKITKIIINNLRVDKAKR